MPSKPFYKIAPYLQDSVKYKEYLCLGELGQLDYEDYDRNDEGQIILNGSEAFCRWPDCTDKTTRYTFQHLKVHLKNHCELPASYYGHDGSIFAKMTPAAGNRHDWYEELVDNARMNAAEKPKVPLLTNGLISKIKVADKLHAINPGISIPCIYCEKAAPGGGRTHACCEDVQRCGWLKTFDVTESLEFADPAQAVAIKAAKAEAGKEKANAIKEKAKAARERAKAAKAAKDKATRGN
ncbi:hypothetical protein N7466_003139 [Penicillium verhagenii]|uniref:uncharacterized protein n=1 Tax=Penicillium verhagenii TaxID=1562060 RepID=UPI0025450621|nr:uncharacterized protein N7466_003139 [Penicillium verhagenii]KAJ5936689.1 hypothetical protein N7466_003139 [Penicillium verhagenii]